jgi:hypothetical protein
MSDPLLRNVLFRCPVHGLLSPYAKPTPIMDNFGILAPSREYHLNSRINPGPHFCRVCQARGTRSELEIVR